MCIQYSGPVAGWHVQMLRGVVPCSVVLMTTVCSYGGTKRWRSVLPRIWENPPVFLGTKVGLAMSSGFMSLLYWFWETDGTWVISFMSDWSIENPGTVFQQDNTHPYRTSGSMDYLHHVAIITCIKASRFTTLSSCGWMVGAVGLQ